MAKRKRHKKSSLWLLLMFLVGAGLILLGLTQSFSVTELGERATREMTVESVKQAKHEAQGETAPFNYAKTSTRRRLN